MPSIIIIGAGLSGLEAARVLEQNRSGDLEVTILEARDRVGGQAFTRKEDRIGLIDMGGDYIAPSHKTIKKLADSLGVPFYQAYDSGDVIMDTSAEGLYYSEDPTQKTNPIKKLDRQHIIYMLDTMAQKVPIESPWKAPKAKAWDAITLEEFLAKEVWTRTVYVEIVNAFRCLMGCESNELSLLSALWSVRRYGGMNSLLMLYSKPGLQKFVGGAQDVCKRMSEELSKSCDLQLQQTVNRIVDDPECKDKVKVYTDQGNTYEADFVIMAVPFKCISRINFAPPLSGRKRKLLDTAQNGSVIKTHLFYEQPFWKDRGHRGEVRSDTGPVACTVDGSVPPQRFPCLTGYIIGSRAVVSMSAYTPEDRNRELGKYYERVFADEKFSFPSHYLEKNWTEDPFSGGWGLYFPPGVLTKYGSMMREPEGRVHFAGSEFSPVWGGFMEGALLSGERTAKQVLQLVGKKSHHYIEKEDAMAHSILEILGSEVKPSPVGYLSVKHLVWGSALLTGIVFGSVLAARTTVTSKDQALEILLKI